MFHVISCNVMYCIVMQYNVLNAPSGGHRRPHCIMLYVLTSLVLWYFPGCVAMVFRLFFFMQILVTYMFRLIPRIQQTIPEYTMPTNYDIKCPWTLTILVEPPRISSENATSYNFWFECKKECCPIFFLWIFRTQIVKITSNYYLGPCSRNLSKSNF